MLRVFRIVSHSLTLLYVHSTFSCDSSASEAILVIPCLAGPAWHEVRVVTPAWAYTEVRVVKVALFFT